jgi:RNA 2',3'-cyclic 3'-phosphodiesterase
MPREKTFLAVELNTTIVASCSQLKRSLSKLGSEIRWSPEDNLHITLLFLGDVEERELVTICRVAKAAATPFKPFRLTVAGLGCFPTPRRPKVLWAGVTEGQNEMQQIANALETPLMAAGCYRREERAFTPHVTLGRILGGTTEESTDHRLTGQSTPATMDWPQVIQDHQDWQAGYTEVSEIRVFTSEHRRGQSVYNTVARIPLGGS